MPEAAEEEVYYPKLFRNWISYAGAALAILAFISFIFLLVFHALGGGINAPYGGLVIFIFVPAFLVLGLLLIPIGMFFEWLRWKRHKPPSIGAFPIFNMNISHTRNVVGMFGMVTLVIVFFSVYGSYESYQDTESVAFCGTVCHSTMQPEFVSHTISDHARVRCVDCHIGPGAQGFVQSKLQGLVQLRDIVTRSVPKPIPLPLRVLRPVRASCEGCHWPAKFYGPQELRTVHYLPDKENTEWDITLLLNVGGGGPWNPEAKGIHWHVGPYTRIEYFATDQQLQNIPWVRYVNLKTGKEMVFTTESSSLTKAIDSSEVHTMDCVDCHDRPTHVYNTPSFLMNIAISAGYVDPGLPDVKSEGVKLLAAEYDSQNAGAEAIANGIESYYQKNYPQIAKNKAAAIAEAARQLQLVYRQNFFPYMKVRWDTYPDNIGHLDSSGCFRCHDGLHKAADGEVIPNDCTECHTISAQGTRGKMEYSAEPEGLKFKHPEDIAGVWQTLPCNQCHTGTAP